DTTRRENHKKLVEEHYAKAGKADEYKGCEVYNDFREVLARKDIDAVVIATPDHWHAIIAIAAAEAGKDIYCEKPLTQTIHEAWALVGAVRKSVIGKISRVETGFGAPAKPCDLPQQDMEPGLDWDMWLGPAPERPYNE